MLKWSEYKKWAGYTNKSFYNKMKPYFEKENFKDKHSNRIYLKLTLDNFEPSIPQEIIDYLNWNGYSILSRKEGTCMYNGQSTRIGKVLEKLGRSDLLKVYAESKSMNLKKTDNLLVAICRHPYDIIGMSTGRGWSTCLDLHDKKYGGYHLNGLEGYLNRGCLMAYLIRDNDLNINNPISRLIIFNSSNILVIDNKMYGTIVPEMFKLVDNWINMNKVTI